MLRRKRLISLGCALLAAGVMTACGSHDIVLSPPVPAGTAASVEQSDDDSTQTGRLRKAMERANELYWEDQDTGNAETYEATEWDQYREWTSDDWDGADIDKQIEVAEIYFGELVGRSGGSGIYSIRAGGSPEMNTVVNSIRRAIEAYFDTSDDGAMLETLLTRSVRSSAAE